MQIWQAVISIASTFVNFHPIHFYNFWMIQVKVSQLKHLNLFHATSLFLYP